MDALRLTRGPRCSRERVGPAFPSLLPETPEEARPGRPRPSAQRGTGRFTDLPLARAARDAVVVLVHGDRRGSLTAAGPTRRVQGSSHSREGPEEREGGGSYVS